MPDTRPTIPAPPTAHELGPVHYGWFDGILEVRLRDAKPLRAIVDAINALAMARFELEIDGERCSILPEVRAIEGEQLSAARQEKLVALLNRVASFGRRSRSLESTLRCTLVYERDTIETLFAPAGGTIRSVSRTRPREDRDRRPTTSNPRTLAGLGFSRGRLALIGLLGVVVLFLLSWTGGLIHRIFSNDVTTLGRETGPFREMLRLELEPCWGNYELRVSRGIDYPEAAMDAERLHSRSMTSADRAAVNSVADGSSIFAQLRDESGRVLDVVVIGLRRLLSGGGEVVSAELQGHWLAHSVALSLDSGVAGR